MKKFISLLLLLPALSAHAEISLIKKMTHAECMQVIRDSLDMYNDMEFCEKTRTRKLNVTGCWHGLWLERSTASQKCPLSAQRSKKWPNKSKLNSFPAIRNLMNSKKWQNSAPRKTVNALPSFIQHILNCSKNMTTLKKQRWGRKRIIQDAIDLIDHIKRETGRKLQPANPLKEQWY